MDSDFLLLYSSNVAVKGYSRSAIYCLDKGMIYLIPSTFYTVLKSLERKPFSQIKKKYENEKETFESYINFLLKEQLAFFTNAPKNFPPIDIYYETSEIISSANVEFTNQYNFELLMQQLNDCNCKYLRLYLNCRIEIDYLFRLLETISHSTLRSLEIVLNYTSIINENELNKICSLYRKVSMIILCESTKIDIKFIRPNIVYYLPIKMSELMKNYEVKNLLIVNYKFFFESHFYNTYYNKKVFINKNGNIRNSILTVRNFGNIKCNKLKDVVSTISFQKLWKIMPKQLKNSEFKYCVYNPDNLIEISSLTNCKVIKRT